jgi:hypothetical protein
MVAFYPSVRSWIVNPSPLELADLLAAWLPVGGPDSIINRVASLKEGGAGGLSFCSDH